MIKGFSRTNISKNDWEKISITSNYLSQSVIRMAISNFRNNAGGVSPLIHFDTEFIQHGQMQVGYWCTLWQINMLPPELHGPRTTAYQDVGDRIIIMHIAVAHIG